MQHPRFFNLENWRNDHEDAEKSYDSERSWRLRSPHPRRESDLPSKARRSSRYLGSPPRELQLAALLRAALIVDEREDLTKHVSALADELGVSPEKLYSSALIEFIEKYENERIARELTEAYANIDQNEDVDFLNNAILHYDPRFADE